MDLKQPTFSLSAYVSNYPKGHDAEFYVTAWLKKNKDRKFKIYRQLVIDNYDFYCLFVFLLLEKVDKPYKKAIQFYY